MPQRRAAIRWSALAFLLVFSIVAVIIAFYALRPGLEAAAKASPEEKQRLAAWYWLLLAVLLFILFAGLALTFRFGRLFFPKDSPQQTQTKYVDAWAESAKRMEVPPEDEGE